MAGCYLLVFGAEAFGPVESAEFLLEKNPDRSNNMWNISECFCTFCRVLGGGFLGARIFQLPDRSSTSR